MKQTNKTIILGYRHPSVKLYRTPLKFLGYVVAGIGFTSLAVAVFPNGLGVVAYPFGFFMLGLVGIKINIKKKISDKIRLIKYKRGWF